jgi:drug/metabolite transporter (DMT)-like permease
VSVSLAFLATILIWSTTPLAIKWSSEGPSFMFAVTARMVIGTAGCLLLLLVVRGRLYWHKAAVSTYLAAGLGIYGAMSCVYWGAQFIPSGLVSVIFGLTPLLTGLMASYWLGEQALTPVRLIGLTSALVGLVLIFGNGVHAGYSAMLGMLSVFMAVVLHSLSTVWVKRIGAGLPVMTVTAGGLATALPFYLITWGLVDGRLPVTIPDKALASIVYLGLFGSVMGFILFYYVLKHVEASRVGLIPLVTPVSALGIGSLLNSEAIPAVVWSGTGLILLGMSVYQWGHLLFRRGSQAAFVQKD